MSKNDKRRVVISFILIFILNCIIISVSIMDGLKRDEPMYRFNERQAVTFVSAAMLGFTSLVSLFIYMLKKKAGVLRKEALFWLLSSIGFFYLCIDEYFMAHEGIDEGIGSFFGKDVKHLNLDGAVIGAFGLIALAVCIYFRKSILRHKVILVYLGCGGLFLAGTVLFHFLERIHIFYEVAEESIKLIGVSFFFTGYLVTLLSFLDELKVKWEYNVQ